MKNMKIHTRKKKYNNPGKCEQEYTMHRRRKSEIMNTAVENRRNADEDIMHA